MTRPAGVRTPRAALLPLSLLVAAIVVAAGIGAWLDPRIGLAVGLGALVFQLGNLAQGTAVAYGCLAVGLFLLSWRDARSALLFVTGPLLAPLGLLALVPLVVQPARGALRRGVQAALAVLAAALGGRLSGNLILFAYGQASARSVGWRRAMGGAIQWGSNDLKKPHSSMRQRNGAAAGSTWWRKPRAESSAARESCWWPWC